MHKLICHNNVIFKLNSFKFFTLIFSIEFHTVYTVLAINYPYCKCKELQNVLLTYYKLYYI